MHNKSFTVDNQATVIGGRNVGDEYFGAGDGTLFMDLDVLGIGPVVDDVSREFDEYWASASSYPLARIVPKADAAQVATVAQAMARIEREPATRAYLDAVAARPFVQALLARRLPLEWAMTRMVADDAAKGLGRAPPEAMLPQRLAQALGTPRHQLDLVSPYFVPGKGGTAWLAGLARRGVKVSVLTNSLEATDVAAVHAGYARRRKPLLEAGVKLFELRREGAAPTTRDRGLTGSSASSLHAKTFSVDRERVFVGSFNFDPRSAQLNTEMGFVIDSPALARRLDDTFSGPVAAHAYVVRLDADGDVQWVERKDGAQRVYTTEPGTSAWQRAMVWVLSKLPIEWLL
jgi:putative cardiolipin synthase